METRLNWRQACEILGCKKSSFYNLIRNGQLVAYRNGAGKRGLWVLEKDCRELVKRVPPASRA